MPEGSGRTGRPGNRVKQSTSFDIRMPKALKGGSHSRLSASTVLDKGASHSGLYQQVSTAAGRSYGPGNKPKVTMPTAGMGPGVPSPSKGPAWKHEFKHKFRKVSQKVS